MEKLKLNYKDQLKDAEVVVNHIKELGTEWTPITLRIIKDIVGVNTCYASGVYQTLKRHEGLESRMTYLNGHKGHRILEFRARGASKLSENQQKYIASVLKSHGMSEDNMDGTMNIVHFLANSGAVNEFLENYAKQAADLLVMRQSSVKMYAQMLVRYGLAEEQGSSIKLVIPDGLNVLGPAQIQSAAASETGSPEPAHESTPEPKPRGKGTGKPRGPYKKKDGIAGVQAKDKDKKKDKKNQTVRKPKAESKPAEEPKQEASIDPAIEPPVNPPVDPPLESPTDTPEAIQPSDRAIALSESLLRFGDIMNGFKAFFDDKAEEVMTEYKAISGNTESLEILLSEKNSVIEDLNQQLADKNSQLEEGNNVLKNLVEDNAKLREQADTYRKEAQKYSRYHSVQLEHNEKLFEIIQTQLQVLTADINTTIVDFTRIPAWEVKPSDTARVQSTVITAITSAMSEIVQANAKGFSIDV